MKSSSRKSRQLSIDLIEAMVIDGNGQEAAQVATLCTQLGIFSDPLQRPLIFFENVESKPFHEPHSFPALSFLEENFSIIQQEVSSILEGNTEELFSDVEEPLVDKGQWQEIVFYEAGVVSERSASLLPKTFSLIQRLPKEIRNAGVVMLSKLSPNTHIVPHCGYTNGRLRAHLGISIPDDVILRVRDQTTQWTEGKFLVMDDSYEHEVWHYGTDDRVVLIVDMFHPDLAESEKKKLIPKETGLRRKLQKMMKDNHVRSIVNDGENIVMTADRFLGEKVRRYLGDLNVDSVQLDEFGLTENE